MATTSDFRNGFVFKMDGDLYSISEFQHVKPGKGGAFVRTKLKNVKTGRVIERTFRSGDKIDDVRLEKKPFQFLYANGDEYIFMDNNTFDQVSINETIVGNAAKLMIDGMDLEILFNGEEALVVELPIFVVLKVAQTDPGFKGDTASGGSKPATLESGAVIQVPLFLEEGTRVKVDTRTGEYVERVK
ncbi:elongation factor P [bacterium]|nr:elongation factor P [bacterium]